MSVVNCSDIRVIIAGLRPRAKGNCELQHHESGIEIVVTLALNPELREASGVRRVQFHQGGRGSRRGKPAGH
jgi:hypothetical protein